MMQSVLGSGRLSESAVSCTQHREVPARPVHNVNPDVTQQSPTSESATSPESRRRKRPLRRKLSDIVICTRIVLVLLSDVCTSASVLGTSVPSMNSQASSTAHAELGTSEETHSPSPAETAAPPFLHDVDPVHRFLGTRVIMKRGSSTGRPAGKAPEDVETIAAPGASKQRDWSLLDEASTAESVKAECSASSRQLVMAEPTMRADVQMGTPRVPLVPSVIQTDLYAPLVGLFGSTKVKKALFVPLAEAGAEGGMHEDATSRNAVASPSNPMSECGRNKMSNRAAVGIGTRAPTRGSEGGGGDMASYKPPVRGGDASPGNTRIQRRTESLDEADGTNSALKIKVGSPPGNRGQEAANVETQHTSAALARPFSDDSHSSAVSLSPSVSKTLITGRAMFPMRHRPAGPSVSSAERVATVTQTSEARGLAPPVPPSADLAGTPWATTSSHSKSLEEKRGLDAVAGSYEGQADSIPVDDSAPSELPAANAARRCFADLLRGSRPGGDYPTSETGHERAVLVPRVSILPLDSLLPGVRQGYLSELQLVKLRQLLSDSQDPRRKADFTREMSAEPEGDCGVQGTHTGSSSDSQVQGAVNVSLARSENEQQRQTNQDSFKKLMNANSALAAETRLMRGSSFLPYNRKFPMHRMSGIARELPRRFSSEETTAESQDVCYGSAVDSNNSTHVAALVKKDGSDDFEDDDLTRLEEADHSPRSSIRPSATSTSRGTRAIQARYKMMPEKQRVQAEPLLSRYAHNGTDPLNETSASVQYDFVKEPYWRHEQEAYSIPPFFALPWRPSRRPDSLKTGGRGDPNGSMAKKQEAQPAQALPSDTKVGSWLCRDGLLDSRTQIRGRLRKGISKILQHFPDVDITPYCAPCLCQSGYANDGAESATTQQQEGSGASDSFPRASGETQTTGGHIPAEADVVSANGSLSSCVSCCSCRRESTTSSDSHASEPLVSTWGPRPRDLLFKVVPYKQARKYDLLPEREKLQVDKVIQQMMRVELWLASLPEDVVMKS